ncbi:uncharacterized protein NEMAJ01_0305 [Nematocida major]|uniref:uncharacterized protein n=1 Tax=Nematocida major TaxID=1912982 RepID=UPI0020072946|nr:uncharacterized protein NEMAJ01_0305 [Nematocida major]KAH9385409.1 hypothetical protein NEMAJ01_0305 [Nematocida major]
MTVLVDTYEVPAHAIMSQLYKTMCYEVLLEEVLGRSYNAPNNTKKYTVLEDISPKTLIALRDIENIIYVVHREILDEREYKTIQYYTNEIIYVENNTIQIVNKKTRRHETYEIEKTVNSFHQVSQKIKKVLKEEAPLKEALLTKKQEERKEASLPFLRAQAQEEVYFPESEEEEDLDAFEEEM